MSALNSRNGATRLASKLVTTDHFKIFTTHLALGRTFTADDGQPVVVLIRSYDQTMSNSRRQYTGYFSSK